MHRDVKPANILLGPEDRVVLTDFGIAKAVDSPALTTSGILIGSPSYLAPERARGDRADAAADLWGLGASLYSAVEGKPPFERPGVLACLTAVVSEEPEPPLHAGPLEPVINGLLRKDPGTRLSAADAEQMLQDVLEQDTAAARTVPMTGPGTRPVLAFGPAADNARAPASEPAPSEPEADTEPLPPVAAAPAPVVMIPPAPAAAGVPGAAGPPDRPAAPVPRGTAARPAPQAAPGPRTLGRADRRPRDRGDHGRRHFGRLPDIGPPDGPPAAQGVGQIIRSRLGARFGAGFRFVHAALGDLGPGQFTGGVRGRRQRGAERVLPVHQLHRILDRRPGRLADPACGSLRVHP